MSPESLGRVGPARSASPASDTRWRLSPLALPLGGRAVSVRAFGWSSAAPWAPFGALVGRVAGWLLACGVRCGKQFRHLHQGDRARVVSC